MKQEEFDSFDGLRSMTIVEKEKEFDRRLGEIDLKYREYFKKRKSLFNKEEEDSIRNHYIYYQAGNMASFGWHEKTDLPVTIRLEVEKIFNEVFKS